MVDYAWKCILPAALPTCVALTALKPAIDTDDHPLRTYGFIGSFLLCGGITAAKVGQVIHSENYMARGTTCIGYWYNISRERARVLFKRSDSVLTRSILWSGAIYGSLSLSWWAYTHVDLLHLFTSTIHFMMNLPRHLFNWRMLARQAEGWLHSTRLLTQSTLLVRSFAAANKRLIETRPLLSLGVMGGVFGTLIGTYYVIHRITCTSADTDAPPLEE
jgi:hypothetical protein